MSHFRFFVAPIVISVCALLVTLWWGGIPALILALLLSVLEVTLSFDNAVVNAKVLERMSPVWQRRFLTWGMIFAVFGTRFVLPVIIVSAATLVSPYAVTLLAITDPTAYGTLLSSVSHEISAFGGMFLLMLSLKYFFDREKETHWIERLERKLSKWGRIEAIELAIALILLLVLATLSGSHFSTLAAGCVGILTFIVMQGISQSLSIDASVGNAGLGLFLYLNVLDAAFSLDGVVGAFALTSSLPIIFAGLGIGAYFVRSITLYLVAQKTLASLPYLEHGAHWAIMGLSVSMLLDLVVHVPEAITGLVGFFFIALSFVSSRKAVARQN